MIFLFKDIDEEAVWYFNIERTRRKEIGLRKAIENHLVKLKHFEFLYQRTCISDITYCNKRNHLKNLLLIHLRMFRLFFIR